MAQLSGGKAQCSTVVVSSNSTNITNFNHYAVFLNHSALQCNIRLFVAEFYSNCVQIPARTRFVAVGGKMDRCQLGHTDQIARLEKLKDTIRDSVVATFAEALHPIHHEGTTDVIKDLFSAYISFGNDPESSILRDGLHQALFQYARCDDEIAGLIRCMGFTAIKKFPDDFDSLHPGTLALLMGTRFLAEASSAMRTLLKSCLLKHVETKG